MKQITINLYTYDELSDKAKEKALAKFNEHNYDPMMSSHIGNLLMEELESRGIHYEASSIDVRYSLGYSQGDGLMFEGTLYDDKGRSITIKHSGRYYHSRSREIDYPEASEKEYKEFEDVYQDICKTIEKQGYEAIEYQQSEEYFREACEANEYTFESNGVMRND